MFVDSRSFDVLIPINFLSKTPPIDSGSESGQKLEKLIPTVEFKNVGFSYPTRQDVQVYRITYDSVPVSHAAA